MRATGVREDPAGLGRSDHLCWAYDDARDFTAPGLQWLRDGLDLGERLLYVADRPVERMRADVASLPDLDELLSSGRLMLASLGDLYDIGTPIDAAGQLAMYASMTDSALAEGLTGLRVLAEVSELVREPGLRAAHVRWEHLADSYMAGHPLSALCAYRRPALGDDVIADLTAVHPLVRRFDAAAPFRLFHDADRLMIAGTVDAFCSARLLRLLEQSYPAPAEPVHLDLAGLDFIDVRGASTLAEFGRGRRIEVTGAPALLRRMWSVLRLEEISGLRLGTG